MTKSIFGTKENPFIDDLYFVHQGSSGSEWHAIKSTSLKVTDTPQSTDTASTNTVASGKAVWDLTQTVNTASSTATNAMTTANSRIPITGDRGQLAGSELSASVSGSQTITKDSPDTILVQTSGNTTLTFQPADTGVCAVKVVCLTATDTTTLTVTGASWANAGTAPTWGTAGHRLILVCTFIAGVVVVNVFDNSQG